MSHDTSKLRDSFGRCEFFFYTDMDTNHISHWCDHYWHVELGPLDMWMSPIHHFTIQKGQSTLTHVLVSMWHMGPTHLPIGYLCTWHVPLLYSPSLYGHGKLLTIFNSNFGSEIPPGDFIESQLQNSTWTFECVDTVHSNCWSNGPQFSTWYPLTKIASFMWGNDLHHRYPLSTNIWIYSSKHIQLGLC